MSRPLVLFLCTGNSARSQMAEALLKHEAGDRFEVHSAGLEPRPIHPFTIQVMEEIGISMAGHRSKSVKEFLGKLPIRYAITVCERAEASCPRIWPFSPQRLFWPFEDPIAFRGTASEERERFRNVRDEINERIGRWLSELSVLELKEDRL